MSVDGISLVEIQFEELIVSIALEVLVPMSNSQCQSFIELLESLVHLRIHFLVVCIDEILFRDLDERGTHVWCFGEVPLRFQRAIVDLADQLDDEARVIV